MATQYIAILADMGQLIFEYDVRDDSFTVWETPPGITIRDADWRDHALVVETGRVDWEHTWDIYKEICRRRNADFRGERVDELAAFLARREQERLGGDLST